MKKEKEDWINNVLNSLEGSEPAKPPYSLFDKINAQVVTNRDEIIPIIWLRIASVAAVLLFMVNIFILKNYSESNYIDKGETAIQQEGKFLISDFNIYEK